MSHYAAGRKGYPAVTHVTQVSQGNLTPTPPLGPPPAYARRALPSVDGQLARAPVNKRPAQMQRVVITVPLSRNGAPVVIKTPTGTRYIESPETEARLENERAAYPRLGAANVERQKKEKSVLGKLQRSLKNIASGIKSGLDGSLWGIDSASQKKAEEEAQYRAYGM